MKRDDLFVQIPYPQLAWYLWLIRLGRVNVETFVNHRTLDSYRVEEVERLRARLDKCRIARNIHGPILNAYSEGFEAFVSYWRKALEFAARLGAGALVMHAERERTPSRSTDEWVRGMLGPLKEIVSIAEHNGVTVLLENHYERRAEAIVRLLGQVNSVRLGACFDIGHFHAFGDKRPIEFLDDYPQGTIREVHLSDNRGDNDSHLALGDGNVDFPRFFDEIDRRGMSPVYVIEAKDAWGALKGMRYLRRIGEIVE
jgi:sugar phosphate isomerase/epimerase